MRQRYAGSMLGLGWAFAAPLLILFVYAAVYLEVFRVRVTGLSSAGYVLYVFSGLVPYLATAEAIGVGTQSVITNKAVLNNTVFPIDLAPVKSVLASQYVMVAGMSIVVLGSAVSGKLHESIVLLPVIWLANVVWLTGVTWILSLLNVVFRDLQNLVTAALTVLMFASPIAYTPAMVPPALKPLLAINPFAYLVTAYQEVIVLGTWPTVPHMIVIVVMSVATFALGSWFFGRAKRVIIDYV